MSKNLLLILAASVDIWAALLITQIGQPTRTSEVWMAISDPQAPSVTMTREPIRIWMRAGGRIGLWPATDRPLTMGEIRRHLETTVGPTGEAVEIRLLCEPQLTIGQWAPVALELSAWADPIRIAPLPPSAGDEG